MEDALIFIYFLQILNSENIKMLETYNKTSYFSLQKYI